MEDLVGGVYDLRVQAVLELALEQELELPEPVQAVWLLVYHPVGPDVVVAVRGSTELEPLPAAAHKWCWTSRQRRGR